MTETVVYYTDTTPPDPYPGTDKTIAIDSKTAGGYPRVQYALW